MKTIANVIWVVLGGLILCLAYYLLGVIYCITIIGIPFGIQIFKLGTFCLWPFGKESVEKEKGSGCLSLAFNIIWIIFGGIELAIVHATIGIVYMVTIIGIPFGYQHFKLAILALVPFGKEIRDKA